MDRENTIVAVLSAAGGQLIGRVRLQKTVYLLNQLGLESGFKYEYHHHRPCSRDLDNATGDAIALDIIKEDIAHRESDGARYSVFQLNGRAQDEALGKIGRNRARELVQKFAQTNVTILELAATIDWLWRHEKRADWRQEVARRKPVKVDGGRLERAISVLCAIGLPPPELCKR
jgi:uncharacterized protein